MYRALSKCIAHGLAFITDWRVVKLNAMCEFEVRVVIGLLAVLVGCVRLVSRLKGSEGKVEVPLLVNHLWQVLVEAGGFLEPLHQLRVHYVLQNPALLVVVHHPVA